ncbi:MAG: polysaccharide biosynthesis tyrosine autokinase [Bacteroidetes bacterium]|nr:polysaccharide biosynthesis tyrosine autokinase [Bacteroidota bacterium]
MNKMHVLKRQSKSEAEDVGFFKQLSFKYLPFWPLFAALIIIFSVLGYFYVKNAIPIYESTASILLKDEKKGLDESKMIESLDLFGQKNIVENEVEVIRSKEVLSQVAIDMKLYAPIFEQQKLKTISAYMSSPITVEMRNPGAIVMPVSKIYFNYPGDSTITVGNNQYALNQWVTTQWGEMRFTKNPLYQPSDKQSKYYFSLLDLDGVAKGLAENLKVSPISKQSTVVTLKLRGPVKRANEAILSDILNVYVGNAISEKTAFAAKTLDFFDSRLKIVAHELDSIENGIQKYRNQKGVVDISTQSKLYLESVQQSDQQLGQVNMQLQVLDNVNDYVQSKNNGGNIVAPSMFGISDPVLSQLLEKLNDKQVQYEKLRKTTGENSPLLVSLRNEIDKLRPSIMDNIKSQRQGLQTSRDNLAQQSNKTSAILSSIPQKERELVEVSREQSIKNSIYSYLLQKREEASISSNSVVANSRIVDRPYSTPFPVSPNKPMIMLVFPLLGILIGAAIVNLKRLFNTKILFRSEIEKATSFPVLGELSFDKSKNPLVMTSAKRSFIMEQFRQLRVAVALGNLGNPVKTKKIIVTSSIEGEGKSFVAANLAISLALAGKKVVLVDFDMHQPKLNEMFNLDNEVGIASYLLGTHDGDQIIQSMPSISHNFSLILSGGTPPNPSELILNTKIEKLLNYLESMFDVVVIDCPPVLPVTDTLVISQYANAMLYVVRHGYTPKVHIKMLDENMEQHNIRNLGIVFNGVKKRGFSGYGYGYGYGHNYAYGYGNKKKKKKKVV